MAADSSFRSVAVPEVEHANLLALADAAWAFKKANDVVRVLSIADALLTRKLFTQIGLSLGEAVDLQQEAVEALFSALARLDPERAKGGTDR